MAAVTVTPLVVRVGQVAPVVLNVPAAAGSPVRGAITTAAGSLAALADAAPADAGSMPVMATTVVLLLLAVGASSRRRLLVPI